MAGLRYVAAGAVLGAVAWRRGAPPVRAAHLGPALLLGALLFLGGNGSVVWAEQRISSGLAALLIASEPLWVALLLLRRAEERPSPRVFGAIALGLAGLAVLTDPLSGRAAADPLGVAVVVLGALSWAAGSLASRTAALPSSPGQAAALQMLAGGGILLVCGFVAGEPGRIAWSAVSLRSLLALAYLIVFGSIVAFTAYLWLLKVTDPSLVSTYAFVNPVIAVLLGWAAGGEGLSLRMGVATALIVPAVVLITLGGRRRLASSP
jgi:drug/metabolite transporter (DMT)-like permease